MLVHPLIEKRLAVFFSKTARGDKDSEGKVGNKKKIENIKKGNYTAIFRVNRKSTSEIKHLRQAS